MDSEMEPYQGQMKLAEEIVGLTIIEIIFYLESSDTDFTEQPNPFGKSLLNGVDIKTSQRTFSIGNRFIDDRGLKIGKGSINAFEFLLDLDKEPKSFETKVVNEKIDSLVLYWLASPVVGDEEFYPQEIEILTENGFLLFSSIEVTGGKVSMEFSNELLVIDDVEKARVLGLGQFGQPKNGRMSFKDFDDLKREIEKGQSEAQK